MTDHWRFIKTYLHKTEKKTIALENSICLGPNDDHKWALSFKLIMIDDHGEFMSLVLVLNELLLLCLMYTDFNSVP